MKGGYEGWSVKLEVQNYQGTIKSSNVIGYITGGVEPDRLIYYDYSIVTNILLGILFVKKDDNIFLFISFRLMILQY